MKVHAGNLKTRKQMKKIKNKKNRTIKVIETQESVSAQPFIDIKLCRKYSNIVQNLYYGCLKKENQQTLFKKKENQQIF